MPTENMTELLKAAMTFGFRAGWSAACHTIADDARDQGVPDTADSIVALAEHPPTPQMVLMRADETVQEAMERSGAKEGDRALFQFPHPKADA